MNPMNSLQPRTAFRNCKATTTPLQWQRRRSHNRTWQCRRLFYIALRYVKFWSLSDHIWSVILVKPTCAMWIFYFFLHFSLILIEQLQVSNWHFAFLIAPLPHQPIRVHARHTAHGDYLTEKMCTRTQIKKSNDSCYASLNKMMKAHLISEQRELTAAGSVVVVQHTGLAGARGAAELVERGWGLVGWQSGKWGGRRCRGNWDTGGGAASRLIVISERGWKAGGDKGTVTTGGLNIEITMYICLHHNLTEGENRGTGVYI